jgi:hypothetical protein
MAKSLLAIACFLLIQQITAGSVWPRPYMMTVGSKVYTLNPSSFEFTGSAQSDILQKALTRYQALTFYTIDGRNHHDFDDNSEFSSANSLTGLNVIVQSLNENLQVSRFVS